MKPLQALFILAGALTISSAASSTTTSLGNTSMPSPATPSTATHTLTTSISTSSKIAEDDGFSDATSCSFNTTEEHALEAFLQDTNKILEAYVRNDHQSMPISAFPATVSVDKICSDLNSFDESSGPIMVPVCWGDQIVNGSAIAEAISTGCAVTKSLVNILHHQYTLQMSLMKALLDVEQHQMRGRCSGHNSKSCQKLQHKRSLLETANRHVQDTLGNVLALFKDVTKRVNAVKLAELDSALEVARSDWDKQSTELMQLRSEMRQLAEYQYALKGRIEQWMRATSRADEGDSQVPNTVKETYHAVVGTLGKTYALALDNILLITLLGLIAFLECLLHLGVVHFNWIIGLLPLVCAVAYRIYLQTTA
jgi:hypothetical protein